MPSSPAVSVHYLELVIQPAIKTEAIASYVAYNIDYWHKPIIGIPHTNYRHMHERTINVNDR